MIIPVRCFSCGKVAAIDQLVEITQRLTLNLGDSGPLGTLYGTTE